MFEQFEFGHSGVADAHGESGACKNRHRLNPAELRNHGTVRQAGLHAEYIRGRFDRQRDIYSATTTSTQCLLFRFLQPSPLQPCLILRAA